MSPIGAFLAGIVTSAEATVVLPAISLALVIAGIYWAFTHSEHGKTKELAPQCEPLRRSRRATRRRSYLEPRR